MRRHVTSDAARQGEQGPPEMRGRRRGQLGVGDTAPDFTLRMQVGDTYHLSDHLGKRAIVVYFYPKDDSPGCTAEACAFRDSYEVFRDAGAEVVGISSDSEATHRGFAERHHLPFTLLSDPHGRVRKRYGVRPTLGILPGRETFILDPYGIIRHTFSSQLNIQRHIEEALSSLRTLHAEAQAEGDPRAG